MEKLSLAQFKKLINTLPVEELSKLRPEQLPENIPVSLCEKAPMYVRSVVEDLILSRNSYTLQCRSRIKELFGQQVLVAHDISKHVGERDHIIEFRNKLGSLKLKRRQLSAEWSTPFEQSILSQVMDIDKILPELREEYLKIMRCLQIFRIKPIKGAEDLLADIEESRDRLVKHHRSLDILLSDYFTERLMICQKMMSERTKTLEAGHQQQMEIAAEIEELHKKLETSAGFFGKTFNKRKVLDQQEEYKTQITRLSTEIKSIETPISEVELTLWLDAFIEANVNSSVKAKVDDILTSVKDSLLGLLNKYCEQQESSARQIARNPFLQIEPKLAIEYTLKSEQFILGYFQRKRLEATTQLSAMADVRIDQLNQVEHDILDELKKNLYLAN